MTAEAKPFRGRVSVKEGIGSVLGWNPGPALFYAPRKRAVGPRSLDHPQVQVRVLALGSAGLREAHSAARDRASLSLFKVWTTRALHLPEQPLSPLPIPRTLSPMGTAIAYLRISSDPEDARLGVERQRADVRALAERLGVDLVEIFEDNDVSAYTERRSTSAWAKVLRALDEVRPHFLLVYKQDRIGRRLRDVEGLEELCRRTGTRVQACEGGDVFANPAWPMLAAVAKMESQNTSVRVRRAQQERQARGLPSNGGLRPFGYEADRITQRPTEVAVLRDLSARILRGESLWENVRRLNSSGILTATGGSWSVSGLRKVLQNPRYVGDLATGRGAAREVIGRGAWKPVFDRATWEALQAALPRVAREAMGPPAQSLLSGIARCGICRTPVVSNGAQGRQIYRCNRSIGGCGRTSRNRKRLDEYVTRTLLDQYSDDVLQQERLEARAALRELERERTDVAWKIDDASTAHAEGRLDSREFYPIYDKLRRNRERLNRELASAKQKLENLEDAGSARRQWDSWTIERRRRWIRARVIAILVDQPGRGTAEIDPSTVTIEFS